MLKWAPYPFLRVAFFLIAGILTYLKWGLKPEICIPLLAFFLALYLLFFFLARKQKSFDFNNLAGLGALLSIFFAGALLTHYRTARNYAQNIIHETEPILYYGGEVADYLTTKPQSLSTTLNLTKIKTDSGWKAASGKIRLTFNAKSKSVTIQYGDILLIKSSPALVRPPLNPEQFDYRQYLANQQIYHQHYLQPHQFLVAGHSTDFSFVESSISVRNYLDKQLRANISSTRAYAVATALVLGIKEHLPDDLKTTYANTGTMHVLAVSGLHVALLFQIISFIVGKLGIGKKYRLATFFILLGFIWGYGFITALSASVMRAVVMFTIILIADTFKKQTNIYNTLSAAAFFLLLYNPYYLLDVGFQLSFLAVFGIVYFQPIFYRWLEFNSQAADFLWKLTTTSLAAQLAVLPLSFFYYHQFPVYFLLANIPAIILSEVALVVGFFLLAFSWVAPVAEILGGLLQETLNLMNACSEWLLKLPLAVIDSISVSGAQTWLLYILLGLLMLFLARKRLFYFAMFTVLLIGFSGWRMADTTSKAKQQYLVFYQVSRATAIGFINGHSATILADSAFYSSSKNMQYAVQPHLINLQIKQTKLNTLQADNQTKTTIPAVRLPDGNLLLSYYNKRILICDKKLTMYSLADLKLDYLVLTNNAFLLPQVLFPDNSKVKVILAGNNFKGYKQKVKEMFSEKNIPVHDLQENGALIISNFN